MHFDKILQTSNLEATAYNFMKYDFCVWLKQQQEYTPECLAVFCQSAESRGEEGSEKYGKLNAHDALCKIW